MLSGLIDLPWWGYGLAALALTHVTIVAVTVFLHRCQAHRALHLHPAASHFFRFWLWLTTGMVTREWVAIHRKHHAKCETKDDPHSPQIYGINRVLWTGVFLYVKEAWSSATLVRYGRGTPDDWIERNLYAKSPMYGVGLMLAVDLLVFGVVPGLLVWLAQMAWIPFWAAGVINGVGHYWGYRNWPIEDEGRNISPWGILIGGEELHNNHHAYPTSAKLSNKWYEIDAGWFYILLLETAGLAEVKRLPPRPHFSSPKPDVDAATLEAVLTHRYDALAQCYRALRRTYREEIGELRRRRPRDARTLRGLRRLLMRDESRLKEPHRLRLAESIRASQPLATVYAMRSELAALCGRSRASCNDRLRLLQGWCRRAEASGVGPLIDLSARLRSYR